MAIIEAISSKANLKIIINYVTQDKKTNINLITGKDCLAKSCLEEMQYTKNFYNKNNGRQYIHIIQSFDPKDKLSAEETHKVGIKLAEKFNGYQALIATHIDKNHLHNHLIINSVSFENGYKIQISKQDLQKLKDYSDKLCLEIGASVIPKKENTQYIKRNEYRVDQKCASWKFKLINAVDKSLKNSCSKEDFIKNMNSLGYQVNWTNTRKYIKYTTPEGYKCRDNKLYSDKYLKVKMEQKLEENKQESMEIKPNNSINNKKELTMNNIADGIINLSSIFSNPQNNNPKRTIKSYRTLSKQAIKEYAIRKANASSFDWEDEEEM